MDELDLEPIAAAVVWTWAAYAREPLPVIAASRLRHHDDVVRELRVRLRELAADRTGPHTLQQPRSAAEQRLVHLDVDLESEESQDGAGNHESVMSRDAFDPTALHPGALVFAGTRSAAEQGVEGPEAQRRVLATVLRTELRTAADGRQVVAVTIRPGIV